MDPEPLPLQPNAHPLDHSLFSKHHIESFDFLIERGLDLICKDIRPIELITPSSNISSVGSIKISFDKASLGSPSHFPFECRLTASTYSAPLFLSVKILTDESEQSSKSFLLGEVPLMVLSGNCLLRGEQRRGRPLHAKKEDALEPGGYFIVNGLEKILRTIVVPRKNFPLALRRPTFHLRQKSFSNCAVSIRSAGLAYRSHSLLLHYTFEGNMFLALTVRKVEYLFPLAVVMKALGGLPDQAIADLLADGDCAFNAVYLLEDLHRRGLAGPGACLAYLGFLIRDALGLAQMKSLSDEEVGGVFLEDFVLPHLAGEPLEKLKCLAFMARKLWRLVQDELEPDDLDALTAQELLTSGQLYGMFLRERLEEFLLTARALFAKEIRKAANSSLGQDFLTPAVVLEKLDRALGATPAFGKKIEHLLATGNLKSASGLDLMQGSGLAIIAERLNNARFWAHLRSVHRGAYFVEMKTTQVRKLLPESWGFLCPVHTPDGGLCGLLNHLAMGCFVQVPCPEASGGGGLKILVRVLVEFGMVPDPLGNLGNSAHLPVVFDGRVLGVVPRRIAEEFAGGVRRALKSPSDPGLALFRQISIALINPDPGLKRLPQFPCVYFSISEGRPLRRVFNFQGAFLEVVDPLEQSYLMIAASEQEATRGHSHLELRPELILSELAAQTPYMVHNQSPRNMYQCQMAKQTMGSSTHALQCRSDNKMYQLGYAQRPLIASRTADGLGFGDFPSGVNSVVAVLAYTGYDIEDAMIINKAAYERGFMHGCVYKTFVLDSSNGQEKGGKRQAFSLLNQTENYKANFARVQQTQKSTTAEIFGQNERAQGNLPAFQRQKSKNSGTPAFQEQKILPRYDINALLQNRKMRRKTDIEGLPRIAEKLVDGDIKLQYFDNSTGTEKSKYYKDSEPSFIDSVIASSANDNEAKTLVAVKLRYNRNPVVGDKFSSRHGQKGVMSIFWPQADMPFSEGGVTPDIIINPNAFPSRMTIGMLIESLAGKAHALRGSRALQDAFAPGDFPQIGELLRREGFNPLGTETLYSGVHGLPLKVEIYQGLVYYQRLRHMVKDKAQARATGPIDALTRQPIKGRKKGGGIRLGEMERDALIAHGVSYTIKERLMEGSDAAEAFVCAGCGGLLGCFEFDDPLYKIRGRRCLGCEKDGRDARVTKVRIPYVLRYLANELAAMNIKLSFRVQNN